MMQSPSLIEKNKQLIFRLLEDVDKGSLNVVDEYYAADYIDHSPSPLRQLLPGLDGIKQAFALLYAAFPDTKHRIDDVIAEGDKVVVRISATATHTGEIFGVPPTGKRISLSSIVIFRIVDGKILERWVAQQGPGVLQQIGINIPANSLKQQTASNRIGKNEA